MCIDLEARANLCYKMSGTLGFSVFKRKDLRIYGFHGFMAFKAFKSNEVWSCQTFYHTLSISKLVFLLLFFVNILRNSKKRMTMRKNKKKCLTQQHSIYHNGFHSLDFSKGELKNNQMFNIVQKHTITFTSRTITRS